MHTHPDSPERRAALHQIEAIRAWLIATPEPQLGDLEALQDQLRPHTDSADPVVAEAAGRVELRLVGALFTAQGLAMRAMGERIRRLARWLPPDRPGDN
jgi:hypothetical protein